AASVLKVPPEQLVLDRSLSSLGFDSLIAVQLAARLETDLQAPVPMAKILGAQNLADLASLVHQAILQPASGPAPGASFDQMDGRDSLDTSTAEKEFFPVTWQQESLWLQHQARGAGNPSLNILLAIRLKGSLDAAALEKTLGAIVQRHAILRTTYRMQN